VGGFFGAHTWINILVAAGVSGLVIVYDFKDPQYRKKVKQASLDAIQHRENTDGRIVESDKNSEAPSQSN
jgi:hypothetical protein